MRSSTARYTHAYFSLRFRPLLSIAKESQSFVVISSRDYVELTREIFLGGQSFKVTVASTRVVDEYYANSAQVQDGGGEEDVFDELKVDAVSDIPGEQPLRSRVGDDEYDEYDDYEEYDLGISEWFR